MFRQSFIAARKYGACPDFIVALECFPLIHVIRFVMDDDQKFIAIDGHGRKVKIVSFTSDGYFTAEGFVIIEPIVNEFRNDQ
ncbi:MAG: hypothetical protein LBH08_03020 [Puniceicoccales bacterium]|jgi:hypothetical protein|nr:hypothetical protein [Puniceicoccales bacterium]